MKQKKVRGEKIAIILPPIVSTNIDMDLVNLTEYLTKKVFKGVWQGGGLLGGEFGYGVHYKNKVFEMFPYYWGDCTCGFDNYEYTGDHRKKCYQTELDIEKKKKGWKKRGRGILEAPERWSYDKERKIEDKIYKLLCTKYNLSYPAGCAVHCTCDYEERYNKWLKKIGYANYHKKSCLLEKPNFRYRLSNLMIRWYKWIGRDMEFSRELKPQEWKKIYQDCIRSI